MHASNAIGSENFIKLLLWNAHSFGVFDFGHPNLCLCFRSILCALQISDIVCIVCARPMVAIIIILFFKNHIKFCWIFAFKSSPIVTPPFKCSMQKAVRVNFWSVVYRLISLRSILYALVGRLKNFSHNNLIFAFAIDVVRWHISASGIGLDPPTPKHLQPTHTG